MKVVLPLTPVPIHGMMSRMSRAITALCLAAFMGLQAAAGETNQPRRVCIELFASLACDACHTVKSEVLPQVQAAYPGRVQVLECDIGETSNYVVLASYQDRFRVSDNEPVSLVVDGVRYLAGVASIRRELAGVVAERLKASDAAVAVQAVHSPEDRAVVSRRFATFSVLGVALAGLVDGLNPCAFATVIFFASLLTVARVRGAHVFLLGGGFILATFVTYFLLGLGLFHGLKALDAWRWARRAIDLGMVVVLVVLAAISFRDAWRYARTGNAAGVTLRMPKKLQTRVHALLRRRITPTSLVSSGLAAGALVTLIESVCTGQIYLPTMAAVARDPQLHGRALSLLTVYNLAFCVPVTVVMFAAWGGTSSLAMADWSRRNVVWGKIGLGMLFLGLAVLVLMT